MFSNTKKSECKGTIFSKHYTINCRGKLVEFNKPLVMGILNLTSDSFYDGGKYNSLPAAMQRLETMLDEEADIIDIGAVSTRPHAVPISEKEEIQMLLPALETIRKKYPDILISIDTFRAEVAKLCIEAGVDIINDISGGTMDEQMFETIAKYNVPYILMHIQGTPETMQQNPVYNDVSQDVLMYFAEKVKVLRDLGVNDIILDPGFGFGKTLEHNYQLLSDLEIFHSFELPLLVGVSRKRMIYRPLQIQAEEALNGTTVINTIALQKGAHILRVHDVKEAVQAVKLLQLV